MGMKPQPIDPTNPLYRRGNPCYLGHKIPGTEQGLRYVKGGACVYCTQQQGHRRKTDPPGAPPPP